MNAAIVFSVRAIACLSLSRLAGWGKTGIHATALGMARNGIFRDISRSRFLTSIP
jgi:hypothetical protein